MVNEEKVKLMTKLAIYENTKGKKQLNIINETMCVSRCSKQQFLRQLHL